MNNEQIIRKAYEVAEKVDVKGWTQCFTPDGTFTDMSIGVTYRGPDGPTGLGKTVEVYAKAFPDMHRELYRFFSIGDVVVVELALQGTHQGPLPTPMGILPATGKRMDAPCCDVFRIVNGKIQSFNCYPSGTVIFAQLGVLSNIEGAIGAVCVGFDEFPDSEAIRGFVGRDRDVFAHELVSLLFRSPTTECKRLLDWFLRACDCCFDIREHAELREDHRS